MAGGGFRRQTGLSSENGTDLRKASEAMYEADEDRIDAAEQLAQHTPHAAAAAFSAIACDRRSATRGAVRAGQLAGVDPSAAAPACLAIARDGQ